jgi:hypothetical protein
VEVIGTTLADQGPPRGITANIGLMPLNATLCALPGSNRRPPAGPHNAQLADPQLHAPFNRNREWSIGYLTCCLEHAPAAPLLSLWAFKAILPTVELGGVLLVQLV